MPGSRAPKGRKTKRVKRGSARKSGRSSVSRSASARGSDLSAESAGHGLRCVAQLEFPNFYDCQSRSAGQRGSAVLRLFAAAHAVPTQVRLPVGKCACGKSVRGRSERCCSVACANQLIKQCTERVALDVAVLSSGSDKRGMIVGKTLYVCPKARHRAFPSGWAPKRCVDSGLIYFYRKDNGSRTWSDPRYPLPKGWKTGLALTTLPDEAPTAWRSRLVYKFASGSDPRHSWALLQGMLAATSDSTQCEHGTDKPPGMAVSTACSECLGTVMSLFTSLSQTEDKQSDGSSAPLPPVAFARSCGESGVTRSSDQLPLPAFWEVHKSKNGFMYFANLRTKEVTWTDPRDPVPVTWMEERTDEGLSYFVHRCFPNMETFIDPRQPLPHNWTLLSHSFIGFYFRYVYPCPRNASDDNADDDTATQDVSVHPSLWPLLGATHGAPVATHNTCLDDRKTQRSCEEGRRAVACSLVPQAVSHSCAYGPQTLTLVDPRDPLPTGWVCFGHLSSKTQGDDVKSGGSAIKVRSADAAVLMRNCDRVHREHAHSASGESSVRLKRLLDFSVSYDQFALSDSFARSGSLPIRSVNQQVMRRYNALPPATRHPSGSGSQPFPEANVDCLDTVLQHAWMFADLIEIGVALGVFKKIKTGRDPRLDEAQRQAEAYSKALADLAGRNSEYGSLYTIVKQYRDRPGSPQSRTGLVETYPRIDALLEDASRRSSDSVGTRFFPELIIDPKRVDGVGTIVENVARSLSVGIPQRFMRSYGDFLSEGVPAGCVESSLDSQSARGEASSGSLDGSAGGLETFGDADLVPREDNNAHAESKMALPAADSSSTPLYARAGASEGNLSVLDSSLTVPAQVPAIGGRGAGDSVLSDVLSDTLGLEQDGEHHPLMHGNQDSPSKSPLSSFFVRQPGESPALPSSSRVSNADRPAPSTGFSTPGSVTGASAPASVSDPSRSGRSRAETIERKDVSNASHFNRSSDSNSSRSPGTRTSGISRDAGKSPGLVYKKIRLHHSDWSKSFKQERLIGSGGMASVHLVTPTRPTDNSSMGEYLAMKLIHFASPKDKAGRRKKSRSTPATAPKIYNASRQKKIVMNEVRIQAALSSHPYILSLRGAYLGNSSVGLVMDLARGGNLGHVIDQQFDALVGVLGKRGAVLPNSLTSSRFLSELSKEVKLSVATAPNHRRSISSPAGSRQQRRSGGCWGEAATVKVTGKSGQSDVLTAYRQCFFSEVRIMTWFVQLVRAVGYMHANGYNHNDLKTYNVFLSSHPPTMDDMRKKSSNVTAKQVRAAIGNTDAHSVLLGDFGMAQELKNPVSLGSSGEFFGTPAFSAPECLQGQQATTSSDVWSLGCILFHLCALRAPFGTTNKIDHKFFEIKDAVCTGKVPALPPALFSDHMEVLIRKLLCKKPKYRPSCEKILRMPFVREFL